MENDLGGGLPVPCLESGRIRSPSSPIASKEQHLLVENGRPSEYQVNMMVTFVLDD